MVNQLLIVLDDLITVLDMDVIFLQLEQYKSENLSYPFRQLNLKVLVLIQVNMEQETWHKIIKNLFFRYLFDHFTECFDSVNLYMGVLVTQKVKELR